MQSTPAGDERDSPGDTVPPDGERQDAPTLVLRPRWEWRAAGPALVVVALAVSALGSLWLLPLVPIAGVLIPSLWTRVEVSEGWVVQRTWRGEVRSTPLDAVDAVRLRRVTLPVLAWAPRAYRWGRFWSVPLTLRLLVGEEVVLSLRCGWWGGWRALARYVALLPDMQLDGRTRGRLERYVGCRLPAETESQR